MPRLLPLLLASSLVAPLVARADGSIQLTASAGVAKPFGDVGDDAKLTDVVEWAFPLEAQLAFRFAKQFAVGAYARYAPTSVASKCEGCTANDVAFGALFQYRFSDRLEGGPWIGAFAGYEMLEYEVDATAVTPKVDATASGFEAGVNAGMDFTLGGLTLGPYVQVSAGQFSKLDAGGASDSISDKGVHGQLGAGIRLSLLL